MNKKASLSLYGWLMILGISVLSLYNTFHVHISWDISWLLEAARRFVTGGNYSQHFVENNPPLIIYIYSLAVALSHYLGSLVYSIILLSYAIALLSLSLCFTLLKKIVKTSSGIFNTLMITLVFAELFLPSTDLGQREDLSFMLIIPYLLLCSIRLTEQPVQRYLAIICGLMAGIGFSIKPHFVIPFMLVVSCMLYQSRNWKLCFQAENISIFAFMLCYLLTAIILNADYFQFILPLVYHYYLNYTSSSYAVLIADPLVVYVIFSLLSSLVLTKQNTPYKAFILILLAADLGFLLVFFLQSQDWYYHLLPCLMLSLVLSTLNIGILIQNIALHKSLVFGPYLLLFSNLLLTTFLITFSAILNLAHIHQLQDPRDVTNQILKFAQKIPHGPFMVISTSLEPNSTLLSYSGLHCSSRFPSLWLLPGALKLAHQYDKEKRALAEAAFQLTRSMVTEDLQQNAPYLVVVDNNVEKRYLTDNDFNYLKFLKEDPAFKRIWQHYHLKTQIGDFLIYIRET